MIVLQRMTEFLSEKVSLSVRKFVMQKSLVRL